MPKDLKARLRSSQLRLRAERLRKQADTAKEEDMRVFYEQLAEDMMRMSLDAETVEARTKRPL